jgi:dTDP-glucose 4,6-dehydratase
MARYPSGKGGVCKTLMRGFDSRSCLMKTILVTGGAGFIGSHFIRYLINRYKNDRIINVDFLTYAGNLKNLDDVASDMRYKFHKADIGDFKRISSILKKEKPDVIINFAAESDNNKATYSPVDFVRTNALCTAVLLEAVRHYGKLKRFHHVSTCEVFGQMSLISRSRFKEDSPYAPRTPYNASKASADHIVRSYGHTFGLPVTISYCANNYGSHQMPEKVIPVFTIKALKDQPLPVFKSKENKREWIHVFDHCRGIDLVINKGKVGEAYNIGTGLEKSIIEIATEILKLLEKPKDLIKIIPDRPSHDTRYLLDSSKIRKLGFKPEVSWEKGFADTVAWYKNNKKWWQPLLKKSNAWK